MPDDPLEESRVAAERGSRRLDVHESTVVNADIWATYFRRRWEASLGLSGDGSGGALGQIADGLAASTAVFLTLMAAAPIAWLYRSNQPPAERDTP